MKLAFWRKPPIDFGLSPADLTRLSTYNGEVGRGLLHTSEWRQQMQALQDRFDEASRRMWQEGR